MRILSKSEPETVIKHRVSYRENNLAADYLKKKFTGLDLNTTDDIFSTSGRNIYASSNGTTYPDRQFILCAHYDAEAIVAADDNAPGVAAVLANLMVSVNSPCSLSLSPDVFNPGSNASGHDAFRRKSFGPIKVSEATTAEISTRIVMDFPTALTSSISPISIFWQSARSEPLPQWPRPMQPVLLKIGK